MIDNFFASIVVLYEYEIRYGVPQVVFSSTVYRLPVFTSCL